MSSAPHPIATAEGKPSTVAKVVPAGRRRFRVIATDVDGTLLSSHHSLLNKTAAALNRAIDAGIAVVIVTGKARGPWLDEVKQKLRLRDPAVYLQGLLVCDARGTVIHSVALSKQLLRRVVSFAKYDAGGVSIALYCRDKLLVEKKDEGVERLRPFKEPEPEAVGDLEAYIEQYPDLDVNKIVFLLTPSKAELLRPEIDNLVGAEGKVTQALDWAIEILPGGYNKAIGLSAALTCLQASRADNIAAVNDAPLSMQDVIAFGDGENDIEMLQSVGLGCAMGNAMPSLTKVADVVVGTNDENGIAQGIETYCDL